MSSKVDCHFAQIYYKNGRVCVCRCVGAHNGKRTAAVRRQSLGLHNGVVVQRQDKGKAQPLCRVAAKEHPLHENFEIIGNGADGGVDLQSQQYGALVPGYGESGFLH